VLATLLAAALVQDFEPWRLDAKLEAAGDRFVVSGSTDLPDQAVLRIEILEAADSEGLQLSSEAIRTKGGSFRVEARPFPGKVPPGRYAARIRFVASMQDKQSVLQILTSSRRPPDAHAEIILEVGKPRDYSTGALAHANDLILKLEEVLREIETAAMDPSRTESAASRAERIIHGREATRALDRHYKAASIADEVFEAMAQCAHGAFGELRKGKEGSAEQLKRFREAAAEWVSEARRRLGLETRLPDSVRGVVDDLKRLLAPLEKGPVDGVDARARELLLQLAERAGRTDYERVQELSASVESLLACVRSQSGEGAVAAWRETARLLAALGSP